jgi:thiol oxidase
LYFISGLRRFPCSLWTLFHFLTVQAAKNSQNSNPLEVLQTMHGYIKHFFGCTDCSKHFQSMSSKNKIWNVTSEDQAVLWLWASHNQVNKRLSGDITEDPEHRKIQFPSHEMCPDCRIERTSYNQNDSIDWDKSQVLQYLKNIFSVENLSNLGSNDERTFAAQYTQDKEIVTNVLSDLDIRMGILLYISMICIMVISIKMLIKRGYRKKLYVHGTLGKV